MINRKALLEAVSVASQAIPSKAIKPVLACVHLSGNRVEATDMDVSISVKVDADLPELLVPAGQLRDTLSRIDCELIELIPSGEHVTVKSGRAKVQIPCHDASEWPAFKVEELTEEEQKNPPEHKSMVCATGLREALNSVTFCCDVTSTRYALGGVLFTTGNLVATDGSRMSVAKVEGLYVCNDGVVPLKAIKSLRHMEGQVTITLRENEVQFYDGKLAVISRLIAGRFPRWQDVIPQDFESSFEIMPETLVNLCQLVELTSIEEERGAFFSFENGDLLISSETSRGSSVVREKVELKGDPIKLKMNPSPIREWASSVFPGQVVKVQMINPDSAVLFSVEKKDYVVMPMGERQ